MEEQKILDSLFAHEEEALRRMEEAYGPLLHQIAFGILGNEQDAEECISDVYLKLWNTIPPYKPDHLLSFSCKMVRQTAIDRFRADHRIKRSAVFSDVMEEVQDIFPSQSDVMSELEEKQFSEDLNTFIHSLDTENRVLFIRRYFFSESVSSLAVRYQMSENSVSARLLRIRGSLKKYLLKRGYFL